MLNAFDEALTDQIAAGYAKLEADGLKDATATLKRLEDMREAYRKINREAYAAAAANLRGNLEEVAGTESEFAARAVKSAGGSVDMRTTVLGPQALQSLVDNVGLPFDGEGSLTQLMPWLARQEAGRLARLHGQLQIAAGLGEPAAQAIKRIRGTKEDGYTSGVLATSRRDAMTIAITANSAIQNGAREATYKRMKSIRFVEWSAILDGRTSQICQGLSGQIWRLDEPHPSPPAHPRCRSITIPRRDDEGTKHKPYGEWLAEQPAHVQDEVLGKARADIFRRNPDFDFQGFFKEGGGYKSLDELRKFDERLFTEGGVKSAPKAKPKAPAPEPAPAPEKKAFTTPIDASVNDNTVVVLSKREVTKRFNAILPGNAANPAYDQRPEFRSVKVEHFGKASLAAGLSDEAASAMLALWPELDRMADAFGIPRLRAIKGVSSSRAIATMGDGILSINAPHFNGFASKIGVAETGADSAALLKLKAEQEALKREIAATADEYTRMRERLEALGKGDDTRADRFSLSVDMREVYARHRKAADKEFKLRVKIATLQKQGTSEVSTWKVGDDIKERPYTLDKYFVGIDKMRSVMFHEFGHHVHQMRDKKGRRNVAGDPPIEAKLKRMYFDRFHGAAPGNIGGRGIERKNKLSTTYMTTDPFEWWAESFAAFMMGRKDLADPDLVKMIEELLDDTV